MKSLGLACAMSLAASGPLVAHPHVFVDGGIDFIFGQDQRLEAVTVTWRFDVFETLYTMAENGLRLAEDGSMPDMELARLAQIMAAWPEDFEGSAHLSQGDIAIALERPDDFQADFVDNRLQVTFTRPLTAPLPVQGQKLDVSFHEATYFYAFSITDPPALLGDTAACDVQIAHFEPSEDDRELRRLLWSLGREDTPEIANVGALFADRITLTCD